MRAVSQPNGILVARTCPRAGYRQACEQVACENSANTCAHSGAKKLPWAPVCLIPDAHPVMQAIDPVGIDGAPN